MPKFLIVYFTRTGHTEQVAKALAERLDADIERIVETRKRHGFWGYMMYGRDAMRDRPAKIEPLEKDPADYNTVILGSPVWASHPSTPMQGFLAGYRDRLKSIACFVTLGGSGAEKTMDRITAAAGRPALARFFATERDLKTGEWKAGMERFADEIAKAG